MGAKPLAAGTDEQRAADRAHTAGTKQQAERAGVAT